MNEKYSFFIYTCFKVHQDQSLVNCSTLDTFQNKTFITHDSLNLWEINHIHSGSIAST